MVMLTPSNFPEANVLAGAKQEEYQPLPLHMTECGIATSCWTLSFWQRVKLFFGAKIWLRVMTFNQGIAPVMVSLTKPELGKPHDTNVSDARDYSESYESVEHPDERDNLQSRRRLQSSDGLHC